MGSRNLDEKISNFMHRKELEFPGLSLMGAHGHSVKHIRHTANGRKVL